MEKNETLSADEMAEKDLQTFIEREKLVEERVKSLRIVSEDIVVIHRHEGIDTLTFLELTEQSITGRRRSSWYGRILKVSPTDCGDSVREGKKKHSVKIGDVAVFNPESAYSLNIAGFEEIWILHIDNILVIDESYDYKAQKLRNAQAKWTAKQKLDSAAMAGEVRRQQAQKIAAGKHTK